MRVLGISGSPKEGGLTNLLLDESLDGGPIIYQEKVDISKCQTADAVNAAILTREHAGLPMIVDKFAKGTYEVKDGKVEYHENE